MEIPQELKTLYKHWSKHVNYHIDTPIRPIHLNQSVLYKMTEFAEERMKIWEKKQNNEPSPWTNDPILQNYRFCNIYRELDKQTILFHKMLQPFLDDFPLWLLNMCYCRLVCNPATVQATGFLSFNPSYNKKVYDALRSLPSPKYGTAYVFPVSAIMRSSYPTRELFFTGYLPQVMSRCAEMVEKFYDLSVVAAVNCLLPVFGYNLHFHWTEVCIDIAYQFPQYINLYKDFPIGPGSLPTMKKLNPMVQPEAVCQALVENRVKVANLLTYEGKRVPLSTENWEGVGCEFRKYHNLHAGKGRHRRYAV